VKFFLLIGLGLVVAGCGRKVVPSTSVAVRDSIVIKEVPRLVEVKLPGETVKVVEYLECDSLSNKPKPKKIHATSDRARVSVAVNNKGILTATGGCDSLREVITLMDREIFRMRHEKKEKVKVVTEYKTRFIDKVCRWFTGIATIVMIVVVFFKLSTP
jgi:hypothetical protein